MEIFMTYILPVLIFMAIGAAAGGLLVLATKFLAVKEDETVAGRLGISGSLYQSMNGSRYAETQSQNAVMRDIKDENSAVLNAVNANNAFDDDFDKAYEQYLLDSANNVDEDETLIRKGDK